MYFSNIANDEVRQFHQVLISNFSIKLTEALSSDLFKVDTIISNKIYKIYPLFNCLVISSTNPNDQILDNRCLIVEKKTDTKLIFISNPNQLITQYSNLGTYYSIDDDLETDEFNNIIYLLRNSQPFYDDISIANGNVNGVYAEYFFDIESTTIVDNGILITNETLTSLGTVTLTNPVFRDSTYTLFLTVYSYDNPSVTDEDSDVEVTVLEIELEKDTPVNIPFDTLTSSNVISFDAQIEIQHNKPVLNGEWIDHINLNAPSPIQTDDIINITASLVNSHDGQGCGAGKVVQFFEIYEPTSLRMGASQNPLQTGDTIDITARLGDVDGSGIMGIPVHFYELYEQVFSVSASQNPLQTGDTIDILCTLKDEDGSAISGELVKFYEFYDASSLIVESTKDIMQTSDTAEITAILKDSDGSLIKDELVKFYEYYDLTSLKVKATKNIIQSSDTVEISARLSDDDGSAIPNQIVYFYEEFEPTIFTLNATVNPLQTNDTTDITAKLQDSDGSLVIDERVDFSKDISSTDWSIALNEPANIIQTDDTIDITATVKDDNNNAVEDIYVRFYTTDEN